LIQEVKERAQDHAGDGGEHHAGELRLRGAA
jgi:hypothetical protein